ncbi:hypothetical protein BDW74DRAFT_184320 [Aspergillus multicolor]|uniref:uncharacterized protein n=1 Tax=Aspergillus multicolor TaxID=41759 RepID=UPI003CCD694F
MEMPQPCLLPAYSSRSPSPPPPYGPASESQQPTEPLSPIECETQTLLPVSTAPETTQQDNDPDTCTQTQTPAPNPDNNQSPKPYGKWARDAWEHIRAHSIREPILVVIFIAPMLLVTVVVGVLALGKALWKMAKPVREPLCTASMFLLTVLLAPLTLLAMAAEWVLSRACHGLGYDLP